MYQRTSEIPNRMFEIRNWTGSLKQPLCLGCVSYSSWRHFKGRLSGDGVDRSMATTVFSINTCFTNRLQTQSQHQTTQWPLSAPSMTLLFTLIVVDDCRADSFILEDSRHFCAASQSLKIRVRSFRTKAAFPPASSWTRIKWQQSPLDKGGEQKALLLIWMQSQWFSALSACCSTVKVWQ